jgi:hypothetical protein
VIRCTAVITGGIQCWAALVLSNAFALASIALLFLLVKEKWDENTAFQACLWSLAYPTAYYSGLIYTESLFMFLVLAYFYLTLKNHFWIPLLCAFLLPISRPTGILFVIPVFMGYSDAKTFGAKNWGHRIASVVAVSAGFGFYLFLMKDWTGNAWSGFISQNYYIHHQGLSRLLNPFGWLLNNYFQNGYTLGGTTTSVFPRLFLAGVMLSLPLLYKAVPTVFSAYTMLNGLVPAFSSDLLNKSYMRYSSVLFPLFILAGLKVKERSTQIVLLTLCFLAQAFLLIAHSLNYWVG